MNVPKLRFKDDDGREFAEWRNVRFGNIATFLKGKGISKADITPDGITPCIRYGELYTEYGETIQEIKSRTNIINSELQLSEANDVIIPASGETQLDIARAACVLHDGIALGGDLNIIKSKENGVFISYYLNHQKKLDIAKLAQGNSVVHLYSSQLKLLDLKIPSKQEQTKIANFLTAIDEKITQLTQKHDCLKQYKKGVMQQIFSQKLRFKDDDGREFPEWGELAISEIFQRSTHSSKAEYIVHDGIYIVVDMGSISRDANLLVTKKTNFSNDFLTTNDLVMAKDDIGGGNIIGRVVQIPENRKYVCSDHVYKLTIKKGYVSYFYYAINSPKVNKSFRQKANGTAQIGISNKTVDNQFLPVPILPEQIKIANFLTAIDDKITQTQTQLEAVKQYKKGLLQQMFV